MIFSVIERSIYRLDEEENPTSGSVGTDWAEFRLGEGWEELAATAVFRAERGVQVAVPLTGGRVELPHEVLAQPGTLYVGVFGLRGTELVCPTVWCCAGQVRQGTATNAGPGTEPTPSVYQKFVNDIRADAEAAKAQAEAAKAQVEAAKAQADAARTQADGAAQSAGAAADTAEQAEAALAGATSAAQLAQQALQNTDALRTQVLEAVEDAKKTADSLHAPYIGENGHWYQYSAEKGAYEDTGVDVRASEKAVMTVNGHEGPAVTLGAEDVGAYTMAQTDSELAAHTENKSNPHGVTAAQVGALAAGGKAVSAANADSLGGKTLAQVMLSIYPVGAIYMSTVSTSPGSLFGGTWTQIQNVFLLAAGSAYAAGKTGGETTHKLTVAEMPAHNHTTVPWVPYDLGKGYVTWNGVSVTGTNNPNTVFGNGSVSTTSVGGNAVHNNMPPYLAVYVWKRTA